MTDTIVARGRVASVPDRLEADTLRAIEARADIDCLGDLHAQRRALLDQLAPLKALHGAFGVWDARRKQLLEAMKVKHRMALASREKRPTEAEIDALAHADEQYERFLDDSYQSKIDFLRLDNELSEINERIESRTAELYFVGKEMGLTR